MRKPAVALVVVSSVAASAAAADGKLAAFTAISPIFGELVMFSQPADFVVAYEKATAGQYIREAVPKGETVDRWTQMITVTGAKGRLGNPQADAAGIAGGFKAACPDTFAVKPFGPVDIGGHDAFAAVASCGRVDKSPDKHSETALIVAIKGAADTYTIQWAVRTAANAENLTIDEAAWRKRLDALGPLRLCPIVTGEAAPYPSCLNRD